MAEPESEAMPEYESATLRAADLRALSSSAGVHRVTFEVKAEPRYFHQKIEVFTKADHSASADRDVSSEQQ